MAESTLKQRLESLKTQVEAVQKAPLLAKAQMAEQALVNAYFLLEAIIRDMENLKGGK